MRCLIIVSLLFFIQQSESTDSYATKRAKLIHDEELMALGGNINLTEQETIVNNCLMQHKLTEIDYAFNNPQYYNFTYHFFKYKADIHNSKVYKIIRSMPKGAALHVHDVSILGADYLMNITYMDDLFVCFAKEGVLLKFSDHVPTESCSGHWQLMSEARRSSNDVANFDAELRKHFTLVVSDPIKEYSNIKDTWDAFMRFFTTIGPMVCYRPVWEQYFYDVLKAFRDQNVLYVEVRSTLPNLYELDGTTYDPVITAKAYKKSINKFIHDYPDFVGAKLIYAPFRKTDKKTVGEYLEIAQRIKADMPEIFAGFDLVGQEDLGKPLIEFADQLEAASVNLTYFFHAGETDWYGTSTDENLIDAILLGAKRLGHAFALPKHPLLVKEVLKRDIGLEVNVISNTVLSLVRDVRNHPLASFLAQGLPVVISSDDPGAWEADPLSEDLYVAFVGVASRSADLRLLKQLALNSLQYSALQGDDKKNAMKRFYNRWNNFVNNFQCSAY